MPPADRRAGFENFMAAWATQLSSPAAPPLPPSLEEIERRLRAAPDFGIVMLPP